MNDLQATEWALLWKLYFVLSLANTLPMWTGSYLFGDGFYFRYRISLSCSTNCILSRPRPKEDPEFFSIPVLKWSMSTLYEFGEGFPSFFSTVRNEPDQQNDLSILTLFWTQGESWAARSKRCWTLLHSLRICRHVRTIDRRSSSLVQSLHARTCKWAHLPSSGVVLHFRCQDLPNVAVTSATLII